MWTSSTVYTCKIAFCSSIIGCKIVILHGIEYFYTLIESQESPLKDGMLHIKICLAVLKLYRVEQHEIGKNLAKNVTPILLFISCSTCHGLGIAVRIFTGSIWL